MKYFNQVTFRPLQFDSLIYGSAERSFCICKIKIKIFIFIFITAPIKHFNDRPKKIASGKKLARSRSVCRFYDTILVTSFRACGLVKLSPGRCVYCCSVSGVHPTCCQTFIMAVDTSECTLQ